MRFLGLLLCPVLACGLFAQTPKTQPAKPKERDLKVERDEPVTTPAASAKPAIPRSYALVIGIGKYENLPANDQLKFRRARCRVHLLGAHQRRGGNFRAENVHRLIGSRATLANVAER